MDAPSVNRFRVNHPGSQRERNFSITGARFAKRVHAVELERFLQSLAQAFE